ncbi:MAG: MFS transporter, partial [Planctomycetes bacterium]|nr:MFS transporter [Planctomycetota bacterium]
AFMSINMVGAFFAAPLAGAWADRFGRHKPLILLALAVDALCFLGLTRTVPFPVFLAIRLVEGCAHITALSLLLSLAARTAEAAGSGRVMGVVGAGITFGVALGAPLGGRLGRSDVLLPLYGGAVLLGLLLLATALLLRDRGSARTRPRLRAILALTRRDRALLAPLAYAFVDRFTVGFFTTVFPLYMKRVFELPVDRIGLMLGLLLGPFALLSYPFGRLAEHTSRTRLLAGGSLCYGIGVTALGAFPPGALPFLMTGLGVLSAVMFVPSLILTTDLADRSIRSTALGAFNACGSLGFVVGPLVGGAVSQWVGAWSGVRNGYAAAFGVAGVAEVVCVVLTLPVLRRLVREGRTT